MEPHAKASVLGNQYILRSILRDREQGQSILNENVTLFRMVLDDDPRMARLPLIVFFDILLVRFCPLPLRFEQPSRDGRKASTKAPLASSRILWPFLRASHITFMPSLEGGGVLYIYCCELIRQVTRHKIAFQEPANPDRVIEIRRNWWHIYLTRSDRFLVVYRSQALLSNPFVTLFEWEDHERRPI